MPDANGGLQKSQVAGNQEEKKKNVQDQKIFTWWAVRGIEHLPLTA